MNKKDLIDALSTKLQEDKKVHYPKWELTAIIEPALDKAVKTPDFIVVISYLVLLMENLI